MVGGDLVSMRWIASPTTVGGLMDALFEAMLEGKVTEDTRITYVSFSLTDGEMIANIYVKEEADA